MKYSGQMKLLCELSKLSKWIAFVLLEDYKNTDASILVYKSHPASPAERNGLNKYAKKRQPQLTFLVVSRKCEQQNIHKKRNVKSNKY